MFQEEEEGENAIANDDSNDTQMDISGASQSSASASHSQSSTQSSTHSTSQASTPSSTSQASASQSSTQASTSQSSTHSTSQASAATERSTTSQRAKRRKQQEQTSAVAETDMAILHDIQNVMRGGEPKDAIQLFTDNLAGQLRSITEPRMLVLVQNEIEQVVFRARMAMFDCIPPHTPANVPNHGNGGCTTPSMFGLEYLQM